jgi:hypothetical protein
MSETRILIKLLRIYFPRISEFGPASEFRGEGGLNPHPLRYATVQRDPDFIQGEAQFDVLELTDLCVCSAKKLQRKECARISLYVAVGSETTGSVEESTAMKPLRSLRLLVTDYPEQGEN